MTREAEYMGRVSIVIHALNGGGSQRKTVVMANKLATAGRHVTLITLDSVATDSFQLDRVVRRIALDLMRESHNLFQAAWNNWRRVRHLRRAIRESRPDTVISVTEKMNILTLLACCGLALDVVIHETTNIRRHRVGRIWSWLRQRLYRRCSSLVVQTERARLHARLLVPDKPVHVIANPVEIPDCAFMNQFTADADDLSVVGMGRLVPEKGFDLLIRAFSQIHGKHPKWKLCILGDGPDQPALEELSRRLDLEQWIDFTGWVSEPVAELRQADLFVLSSRYEGMPSALLEAMACGLPVISCDCEAGPAEIIRDGVDGRLVAAEDVTGLAEVMDELMQNGDARERLGAAARDAMKRFGVRRFLRQWEAVLNGASEEEVSRIIE